MKNNFFSRFFRLAGAGTAALAVTLAIGLVLGGCPTDSGDEPPANVRVNDLNLTGKVTAPVSGAAPVTAFTDTAQYTGTVAWQTASGASHTGAFAASTVYKAVVSLTPKSGFTFTGVTANSFTYSGATTVTNAADSGTVSITFPATAAAAVDTTVTDLNLTSKVSAPVRGATAVTAFTDTAQYTGTVAWQTASGASHTGVFAVSTVYKAVVSLTPKSGFTFTGLAANSFTYSGATTVTNAADSGTVSITFPATAAVPGTADLTISFNQITEAAPVLTSPTIHLASANGPTRATLTVTNSGQYTSIAWRVDNQNTSRTGASFTLDASNTAYNRVGVHYVSVEVVKGGVPYNKTVLFTVEH